MADGHPHVPRAKGRSASICASSLEALPHSESPQGRRRRPAARTQSARLTHTRSVKRKVLQDNQEINHCNSEPKLTEPARSKTVGDVSPNIRRKSSTKRPSQQRKSTAFLDVPDTSSRREEEEDEESYRLRSFSFTNKGIINRGDSFRRRQSRSNSLCPPITSGAANISLANGENGPSEPVDSYNVALVGAKGVGKAALISQFMTSEFINAYDKQNDSAVNNLTVCIMLNGEESELNFQNISSIKEIDYSRAPDAFVVLYSVVDKASFLKAEAELNKLQDADLLRSRPAILVATKVDLARSRTVSIQDGKCLACTHRAKFIEVSVGINHNVDELLVGILAQIRLKLVNNNDHDNQQHWYKSRGMVKASMKARQMFSWIFGKEDSRFKNCENLHTL